MLTSNKEIFADILILLAFSRNSIKRYMLITNKTFQILINLKVCTDDLWVTFRK